MKPAVLTEGEAQRTLRWVARAGAVPFAFTFPGPAVIMGILNVTPDSFSDGGRFFDTGRAVERAQEMAAQGAGMIDVGGESTRPGSLPVAEEEERRRVVPVIERLARTLKVPISIDTMKPGVARAALEAGAAVINDVGAGSDGTGVWHLAAESGAGYVCMHMRGRPADMQSNPSYENVVREVEEFLRGKIASMADCGIEQEQVILDPGIGFGKKLAHNLELLARIGEFSRLQRPIMLGVSRKSFIKTLLGAELEERLPASLACACLAVAAGVNVIRVHDVAETVQAVRMTEAILAKKTECLK